MSQQPDPLPYRQGGYIAGPGTAPPLRLEHLGHTVDGFPLVSINGGEPQAVITADRLRQVAGPALEEIRRQAAAKQCPCDCGPKALRDAADAIEHGARFVNHDGPVLTSKQFEAAWLRARADELEADRG